ncbi:hypothetical protein [Conexibacter woesei]|uniref:hypothetical protein n=1 Tax=Conexibacter woesei TaxID=191495 RepID=UPI0004136F00|nr:hypothetical protein [Conexibacter woesei]
MSAIGDGVDWVQARVDAFTSVDFAFLLIGFAALYWVWRAIRSSSQLGPIEIAPIVCDKQDGGQAPEIEALASLLRERLAHSGFTPTIPGGVPKPDPIAALAASDIPQVGWIAQLLDALRFPQPPSFTIRVTLLRAPAGTYAPRLRYWLDGGGTPLLSTVRATTDEIAVRRLAACVFAHISQVATGAFPPWARWTSPVAVAEYFKGQEHLRAGDAAGAFEHFEAADRIETTNSLPRLQLATLTEIAAVGEREDDDEDPVLLATALGRYRAVANERPDLVEPHYRASIVAAMLVPLVRRGVNDTEIAEHAGFRDMRDSVDLIARLNREGKEQAGRTRRLLWLPSIALTHWRMRNRYELRGDARRELRQTMRLSRQCRQLRSQTDRPWRRRVRGLRVRFWYLGVRRPSCGWQAYYNAGCFFALLYRSTRDADDARRARRYLADASERAGRQLDAKWMSMRDPDLQPLRDEEVDGEAWDAFMLRLRGSALKPRANPLQPSWAA